MRVLALALLVPLAYACNDPNFPELTDIENLRILAIKAEPPELPREGGYSAFNALVVGNDPADPVTLNWELCPFPGPELLSRACLVPDLQCSLGVDEATVVILPPLDDLLGSDEVKERDEFDTFQLPEDAALEVQVRLTATAWGPDCGASECPAGYTCQDAESLLSDMVSCEELYLGEPPEWAPAVPAEREGSDRICAQQRVAVKNLKLVNQGELNTNPIIDHVRLDLEGDPVTWEEAQIRVLEVAPPGHPMNDPDVTYIPEVAQGGDSSFKEVFGSEDDGTLPVSLMISDDVRETVDLDGLEAKEDRLVSWFADLGSWTSERSGEVGAEAEDGISAFGNNWIPPSLEDGAEETGRIWGVLRDGRGGVDWVARTFTVRRSATSGSGGASSP